MKKLTINRKRKFRISIRANIFFAFSAVFILSFATILIAFFILANNYIEQDAASKIELTARQARLLASNAPKTYSFSMFLHEDEETFIIDNIVRALDSTTEVNTILVNNDHEIIWPTEQYSIPETEKAEFVIDSILSVNNKWNDYETYSITTSSGRYFYSTLPIFTSRPASNSDNENADFYLIFYLNTSTTSAFAKSLSSILIIVMFFSLILGMISSFLVSFNLTHAIRNLTRFSERIGKGKFDQQEFHFNTKELMQLGTDMNSMAKKLEHQDLENKTFFQNASHELRTPLMSIQGYAEGIKYGVFDNQNEAVDIIISESERLSGMVENLLSISRLDLEQATASQIKMNEIDIAELVDSVCDKARGSAIHSNKTISIDVLNEDIRIMGNDNDLIRAIENILSNAIRHAKSSIEVVCSKTDSEAIVTITDDGDGIAPDFLPHVFERFAKGSGGKHGIGLALVDATMRTHKGKIEACNRNDEKSGAIFTMHLPLIQ